MAVIYQLLVFT